MFDHAELEKKKQSYQRLGMLHVFYLEYMNQVRAPEAQVFHDKWTIRKPEPDEIQGTAIYLDPAISEKETADAAVIVVAAMLKNGHINVLEEWRGRSLPNMPRQIVDNFFRLAMKWKPHVHGFEGNAWQAALQHLLAEEMFRRHYYFEPHKVTNTTRKAERIQGIVATRHSAGYLEFSNRLDETFTEMLDWNPEKREQPDDGPDALAGVISLLDPYAANAHKNPESMFSEDSEYDEYGSFEEAVGSDSWRMWD